MSKIETAISENIAQHENQHIHDLRDIIFREFNDNERLQLNTLLTVINYYSYDNLTISQLRQAIKK